jgi:hypothetical protein
MEDLPKALKTLHSNGFDAALTSAMFVITMPSQKIELMSLGELKNLILFVRANPGKSGIILEQEWRKTKTRIKAVG